MAPTPFEPNFARPPREPHAGAAFVVALIGWIASFAGWARAGADSIPPQAQAREEVEGSAALKEIATTFGEDGSVVVEARGANFLGGDLREAILSGMEATIEYEVEIERHRSLWFDETVAAATFRRTLKYDTLKKEYRLTTEGAEDKIEVIQDLDTARSRIETLQGFVLPRTRDTDPEGSYFLRVRARLDNDDLAFPVVIRRLLFFAPEWGFDTGWVYKSVRF